MKKALLLVILLTSLILAWRSPSEYAGEWMGPLNAIVPIMAIVSLTFGVDLLSRGQREDGIDVIRFVIHLLVAQLTAQYLVWFLQICRIGCHLFDQYAF